MVRGFHANVFCLTCKCMQYIEPSSVTNTVEWFYSASVSTDTQIYNPSITATDKKEMHEDRDVEEVPLVDKRLKKMRFEHQPW